MMMDEGPQGPTDWEIDMGDIKCVTPRCPIVSDLGSQPHVVQQGQHHGCHKCKMCLQFSLSLTPLSEALAQLLLCFTAFKVPKHLNVPAAGL